MTVFLVVIAFVAGFWSAMALCRWTFRRTFIGKK
jgi:hypothetical protein